jgi:pimeloyl-ACP methyl ester carboxylesterase
MKSIFMKIIPALLIIIVLLSNSTAVLALEKTGTDSRGQYAVKDPRDYPIIFIPGMAGSTLDIGGGGNAWPGSVSYSDEAFKVLALKDDGKNPLYGTRVIATDVMKYGAGDVYEVGAKTYDWRLFPVYQGFYDYMEKQGYKLNVNEKTGKVFFDFPYDFRQDNHNWTKLLDKKVNDVLKKTGSDKVILVGHSMGGLQARLYMKDAKRAEKVAAVIFMGTPHHGSPMAFYAYTEGYNFGNSKLSDSRMWEIAANWMGGYQLLPDYPFIIDADNPSNMTQGLEILFNENWICAQEYARYQQAQSKGEKYKVNKAFPNDDFAKQSVEFHRELGDSVDKYPGVKYYMIRGTNQETVEYLVMSRTTVPGLKEPVFRFEKQMSPKNQGDGTVPLQGALVNGLDGVYEVPSEHGAIPANSQAQDLLTGIRKDVNNEEFRQELVGKARVMAGVKLAEFARGGFSGDTSIWSLLGMYIFGRKDEEKQDMKKEIRKLAASVIRNCRVNITINPAKTKADKDREEHIYLVIDEFKITDSGTGIVSGANIKVTVDSFATYEKVLKDPDDVDALVAAYKSNAISVQGGGLTNMLISKLLEWYKKYM